MLHLSQQALAAHKFDAQTVMLWAKRLVLFLGPQALPYVDELLQKSGLPADVVKAIDQALATWIMSLKPADFGKPHLAEAAGDIVCG